MKNYLIIIIICIIIFSLFMLFNHLLKKNVNMYENFDNNSIPKIIIQTWKDDEIPEKYKNDMESVRRYNSDYQILFFTDDAIESFLNDNYPEYYSTYTKLPVKIQKIDFFRYVAVYHYGGFYFDLDITALYPLDDLLNYESVFPVDQNINIKKCNKDRYKKYCEQGMDIMLGQYAFGAKPKNDFIKTLIETIHNNINVYISDYKVNGKTLQYVYSSTGPDFVTDVYIKYNKKNDVHILESVDAQFFGKYAKHNYFGTWKNNKNSS